MAKSYSMQEHEESMTIFYYRRTGVIYSYGTGIQSFESFGQHAEEYELILDYMVVPKDRFILDNMKMFVVDVENKTLIYNQEIMAKYSMYK